MKKKLIQPIFFHPSSILLIDDDRLLLHSIMDRSDGKFPFIGFTNPLKVKDYLESHAFLLDELSRKIVSDIDPSEQANFFGENISINFSALHGCISSSDFYSTLSVAVIDKVMKEKDGLELALEIKELGIPLKSILLTGNTGVEEVISAFNNGVIDAFIEKSKPDALAQLEKQITKLGKELFCEMSAQLLGPIATRLPLLFDHRFSDFFSRICKENQVVSYYLLDMSCSFLLLTSDGHAKIFFAKSAKDFTMAYDLASSDKIDVSILPALRNKTAFPESNASSHYLTSTPDKWKMVAMEKIADLDLYFSILDSPIEPFSFDLYMNEIWKPTLIE